jgi:hypothetical protein
MGLLSRIRFVEFTLIFIHADGGQKLHGVSFVTFTVIIKKL